MFDYPGDDQLREVAHARHAFIGFLANTQKAIFESFTKAISTTTRTYDGTDLDLAISPATPINLTD